MSALKVNPVTAHLTYGLAIVAGLSFGVLSAWALAISANDTELDTGPRVFPYNGVLDLHGVPFEGSVDVQVTLLDQGGESWTENHEEVQVSAGRFGVNIGSAQGGVPDWVFDAESVSLRLAMREAQSEEPHTPLAGLQSIKPVPFTFWAAEGNNVTVRNETFVEGSLTVTGSSDIDELVLEDNVDLNLTGPLGLTTGSAGGLEIGNDGSAQIRYVQDGGSGDTQFAFSLSDHANNTLLFEKDGEDLLEIKNDEIDVRKDLTVPAGSTFRLESEIKTNGPSGAGRLFHFENDITAAADTSVSLGSSSRRFCVLAHLASNAHEDAVGSEDRDAECDIRTSGSNWRLYATRRDCIARCMTW